MQSEREHSGGGLTDFTLNILLNTFLEIPSKAPDKIPGWVPIPIQVKKAERGDTMNSQAAEKIGRRPASTAPRRHQLLCRDFVLFLYYHLSFQNKPTRQLLVYCVHCLRITNARNVITDGIVCKQSQGLWL